MCEKVAVSAGVSKGLRYVEKKNAKNESHMEMKDFTCEFDDH